MYVFTGRKSGTEISMHGFPVFPWSEPKYPSLWPTIKTCKVLQFKMFCHPSLFFIIHVFYSISPWSTDTVIQKRFCFPISESAISARNTILHCISSSDLSRKYEKDDNLCSLSVERVWKRVLWAQGRLCVFFSRFLQRIWSHHRVITIPLHTRILYCMG